MNWHDDLLETVERLKVRHRRQRYIKHLAVDIRVRMNIDENGREIAKTLWNLGTYSNWRAVETWLDHRFPDRQYRLLPSLDHCCRALAHDLAQARATGKGKSYSRK